MTAPKPFLPPKSRDAWATIRGYVYQVDTTILRWLALDVDDCLELECGEDIDTVTSIVGRESEEEVDRVLEQVKHREKAITLRSPEAREAIHNCLKHKEKNPDLNLIFRYSTNAVPGKETGWKSPLFPNGISAWEALRSGDIKPAFVSECLESLGEVVPKPLGRSAQSPDGDGLGEVPTDLHGFVRSFEWSTGVPGSTGLRSEVQSELIRSGRAVDEAAAEIAYQALFFEVFRVLSLPGKKRLTADMLSVLTVGRPPSNPEEEVAFGRLQQWQRRIEERIEELEAEIGKVWETLGATDKRIAELAEEKGVRTRISRVDQDRFSPIEEPPAARFASERKETIRYLISSPGTFLLGLHGPGASGKTQLALGVAKELGGRRAWIRLNRADGPGAVRRLLDAVTLLTAQPDGSEPIYAVSSSAIRKVAQSHQVIVFDDVPEVHPGSDLSNVLTSVIGTCLEEGCSVLTTSQLPLTPLRESEFSQPSTFLKSPPLTEVEIQEVLESRGGRLTRRLTKLVSLLAALTKGHPVLVQAAGQYLDDLNWRFDSDTLEHLLTKQYSQAVTDRTVRAVLREVQDGGARDLLYRLTLIGREFNNRDVELLAAVPPVINTPRQRFQSVIGPWIQPTGEDRYDLSPLVQNLGPVDVPPGTIAGCHSALAAQLLSTGVLGPTEAIGAFSHLAGAGEYDRAGLLLVQVLQVLAPVDGVPSGNPLDFFGSVWVDTPLPEGMDPGLRAFLRAYQATFLLQRGRDASPVLADLDRVLEEDAVPPWAAFGAALRIVVMRALDEPDLALRFGHLALDLWPSVSQAFEESGLVQAETPFPPLDTLVLMLGSGVESETQIESWLDLVRKAARIHTAGLFDTRFGREGAVHFANRMLLRQWEHEDKTPDWAKALRALELVEEAGEAMEIPPLRAAAIAGQVIAHGEMGRLDEALRKGGDGYRDFDEPDNSFAIAKALGFTLLDANRFHEAREWLKIASETGGDAHQDDRVTVLLRLSQISGEEDPFGVLNWNREAVAAARRLSHSLPMAPEADETEYIDRVTTTRALGELALAERLAAEEPNKPALDALLQGIELLSDAPDRTDEAWRRTLVAFGHLSGFLVTELVEGSPPAQTPAGDAYVLPNRGWLIAPRDEFGDLYDASSTGFLAAHAALFAERIGDQDLARSWNEKALEELRSAGLWGASVVPLDRLRKIAIANGNVVEALRFAEEEAYALVAERSETGPDGHKTADIRRVSKPPEVVLSESPEPDYAGLDSLILRRGIVPSLMGILGEKDPTTKDEGFANVAEFVDVLSGKGPPREVWKTMTQLLDLRKPGKGNLDALLALKNSEESGTHDDGRILATLAGFFASLDEDCPIIEALGIHLYGAFLLENEFGSGDKILDGLAGFLNDYWWMRFNQLRFKFHAPRLTESALQKASKQGTAQRFRGVLKAISDGLRVRLPPGAAQWLTGSTEEEDSVN